MSVICRGPLTVTNCAIAMGTINGVAFGERAAGGSWARSLSSRSLYTDSRWRARSVCGAPGVERALRLGKRIVAAEALLPNARCLPHERRLPCRTASEGEGPRTIGVAASEMEQGAILVSWCQRGMWEISGAGISRILLGSVISDLYAPVSIGRSTRDESPQSVGTRELNAVRASCNTLSG